MATAPGSRWSRTNGPSLREVEFDILYGEGISKEGDLLDMATAQGLITKSGAWYSHGSERIAQGRENAKTYLKDTRSWPTTWNNKSGLSTACCPKRPTPRQQE